jgi:predicted kinase
VLRREPREVVPRDGRATLYLLVGLPGAGKTTRAKEIEVAHAALRLTPDEWILALYGDDLDRPRRDAVRDPVEALQWQLAQRALVLGCNVVLDWGFWSRAERATYRARAEALGATVKMIFLDAPTDELWSRIARREESTMGTLTISRAELDEWSASFEPPTADELA